MRASDLYSLGVSLYEMCTNRRPFQGDSDYSIMAAHLNSVPVAPIELDPSLPAALNDIILMSIAKDPEHRFQTADAFRKALNSVTAGSEAGRQFRWRAARRESVEERRAPPRQSLPIRDLRL